MLLETDYTHTAFEVICISLKVHRNGQKVSQPHVSKADEDFFFIFSLTQTIVMILCAVVVMVAIVIATVFVRRMPLRQITETHAKTQYDPEHMPFLDDHRMYYTY